MKSAASTHPATTLSLDSLALVAHVRACDRARGRGFALGCLGERVHALLAPRLVTTVLAATGLILLAAACA